LHAETAPMQTVGMPQFPAPSCGKLWLAQWAPRSGSPEVPPTLTIRPGFPVRVLVTRDLVIAPQGG